MGIKHDKKPSKVNNLLGVQEVNEQSKVYFNRLLDKKLSPFNNEWTCAINTNEEVKALFIDALLKRPYWTGNIYRDYFDCIVRNDNAFFGNFFFS